MKILVEIKENEILKAADEMITAADDLSKKAWALKGIVLGEERESLPEGVGNDTNVQRNNERSANCEIWEGMQKATQGTETDK